MRLFFCQATLSGHSAEESQLTAFELKMFEKGSPLHTNPFKLAESLTSMGVWFQRRSFFPEKQTADSAKMSIDQAATRPVSFYFFAESILKFKIAEENKKLPVSGNTSLYSP